MAGGYPIIIDGNAIRTSEHLYQALRFPDHPDIQIELINIASPMAAKMFAKKHIDKTRADWESVKVLIMRTCIQLKMKNTSFVDLLTSTQYKQIVEYSRKDKFWGAVPKDENHLVGANVLGNLLVDVRDTAFPMENLEYSIEKYGFNKLAAAIQQFMINR